MTELNVASNGIQSLNNWVLSQLTHLNKLDISNNGLTAVTPEMFPISLQQLSLRGNLLFDCQMFQPFLLRSIVIDIGSTCTTIFSSAIAISTQSVTRSSAQPPSPQSPSPPLLLSPSQSSVLAKISSTNQQSEPSSITQTAVEITMSPWSNQNLLIYTTATENVNGRTELPNIGLLVGAIVGTFAATCLLFLVIILIICLRNKKKPAEKSLQHTVSHYATPSNTHGIITNVNNQRQDKLAPNVAATSVGLFNPNGNMQNQTYEKIGLTPGEHNYAIVEFNPVHNSATVETKAVSANADKLYIKIKPENKNENGYCHLQLVSNDKQLVQ